MSLLLPCHFQLFPFLLILVSWTASFVKVWWCLLSITNLSSTLKSTCLIMWQICRVKHVQGTFICENYLWSLPPCRICDEIHKTSTQQVVFFYEQGDSKWLQHAMHISIILSYTWHRIKEYWNFFTSTLLTSWSVVSPFLLMWRREQLVAACTVSQRGNDIVPRVRVKTGRNTLYLCGFCLAKGVTSSLRWLNLWDHDIFY